MKNKTLLRSAAITLCMSISLTAHTSHADLVAIGLGIITAPVTIPMGVVEAIKSHNAKKKHAEQDAEQDKKAEEYNRAQLQDLANFVEKGCPAENMLAPEAEKIRYFTDVKIANFPKGIDGDLYYLRDSNGIELGDEGKVRETFGQIDDIPAQEARKFAVKKLKEITVRYTNSKETLRKLFASKDLSQLSKDQRQLLANFTCDAAQAELSEEFFHKVALARSVALRESEKKSQQTQQVKRVETRKSVADVNGVN